MPNAMKYIARHMGQGEHQQLQAWSEDFFFLRNTGVSFFYL